MILHDHKSEKAFLAIIDCRFPYNDPSASMLIQQGWTISLNAAFLVLHELCRPHLHRNVSKELLRQLISEWATGPDHALKIPLLDAARALVDGNPIPWRKGIELMSRVGEYDGQYNALAIVYFASDCDSQEGDDALELANAQIRLRWEAKGV